MSDQSTSAPAQHDVQAINAVNDRGFNTALGLEAFIWDAAHGMRNLQQVLTTDYGLDLTGRRLKVAWGMSPDGSMIVGFGVSPNGSNEAFLATIPEPSGLWLLGAAALARLRRRRGEPADLLPA